MNIIQQLDKEHIEKLGKTIPDFQPGDTVIVNVKVKEGERSRVQAYEGVCIARSGAGFQESFTVRKISYGEGVERVFPVYSPNDRFHQGRPPRPRAPRQALLSARSSRQVGPYRRARRARAGQGREGQGSGSRRVISRAERPGDIQKRGHGRAFLHSGSASGPACVQNLIAPATRSAMR